MVTSVLRTEDWLETGMNKLCRKKEVFSILIWMMVLELYINVKSH